MSEKHPWNTPLDVDDRERADEAGLVEARWAPTVPEEELEWRRHFAAEMQPLVDSLRRLRERGLLE